MIRNHQPLVIDTINGLYQRGGADDCPPDHLSDCENLQSFGTSGFQTRFGIDVAQDVAAPLGKILRIYNYITQDANTYLVLVEASNGDGEIYHVVDEDTVLGPILTITTMTDFEMVPYAGRAYITPFTTFGTGVDQVQKGIDNEFLYVYLGEGDVARKAAGAGPSATPAMAVANDGSQLSDAGNHLFAVCLESDTGYLSPPGATVLFNSNGTGFDFSNIPVGVGSQWVARQLVMTKKIDSYNGNTEGYEYFLIPNGRIDNNVSTTLPNITVFDADLLESASHLFDNYTEIPAGCNVTIYHERLCLCTTFDDISLILVSAKGEPEAINQIDGLIIAPLDGNPLTNMQELRDILYAFKKNRTIAVVDNGDAPSSWPVTVIDYGIGCPVHGIATVADSGSANIDYLLVASYQGVLIFNGMYAHPELSWKISTYWLEQDQDEFANLQILNDTVNQIIYISLPNNRLLVGDYSNGLDPKKIRWWPWRFEIEVTTIAIINNDQLVIGSYQRLMS